MVDQVGVQRVVPGDQDHQRALARAARIGPPAARTRRRCPEIPPAARRPTRRCRYPIPGRWWWPARAARLRPAPVRSRGGPRRDSRRDRRPPCHASCGAMSSSRARAARAVSSAPRRDRTKVSVRAPCATRSAIIRAASAPADRRTGAPFSPLQVGTQLGFPQRDGAGALRRAVDGDLLDGPARSVRLPSRRARRWWRWRRSPSVGAEPGSRVAVAQPQQPAQDHRHVRAENPSVVMAFVDHDVAQSAQEDRPAGVVAQQRQVDHVRIGEQPP